MREKLEEIRAARVEQEIRVQEASNLFLKVNKEIRFQISGFDDTVLCIKSTIYLSSNCWFSTLPQQIFHSHRQNNV